MEGIVFEGDRTSEVVTFPDPTEIPDGYSVIVVQGSGICGTDLHRYRLSAAERGEGAKFRTGHEAVGYVADSNLSPTARRVAVHQAWGCLLRDGPCPEAADPRSKRCPHTAVMGLNTHGANATYQVVPTDRLMDLPDQLDWRDAVLLVCNFGTAWSAIRAAGVEADSDVLVAGLGPVGILSALICQHRGANVTCLERSTYRLEYARSLGLEVLSENAPIGTFRGYDRILETTGSPTVTECVIGQLAPRGAACFVGLGPAVTAGGIRELIFKEASLIGSLIFDIGDWSRIVADYQAMDGIPRSVISHYTHPDSVPEIYDLADRGQTAKVVFNWAER